MDKEIILRMFAYVHNNRFYMICLDTDIAVVADSFNQLLSKMEEATLSYFKSFKDEEILAGKYIRKAPLKYRVLYKVQSVVVFIQWIRNYNSKKAYYDNSSGHLRFA
jgi:hypothetical protein